MGVYGTRTQWRWVEHVEQNLRPADRAERAAVEEAAGRKLPSLRSSCAAARFEGMLRPTNEFKHPNGPAMLVYGCQDSMDPEMGVCWMMGTPDIEKHPLAILKFAKKEIARWLQHYRVIYNFVDSRNELHVRWLQMMGFTLGARLDVRGVEFIHFFKERS